jgi:3-isopropylmalate/(R)-2-methylmalate dehydratase small subunit
MEPVTRLKAVALPVPEPNVDTDQILPARFLQKPRAADFGSFLFRDLRFDAAGHERGDFLLNRSAYRNAKILVGGPNFACGSSREHAVWALYDYGFRAVIAPGLGDIFQSNAAKNGLLTIVLPDATVAAMLALLAEAPGMEIAIDLPAQTVTWGNGEVAHFQIDPYRKQCLVNGLDELGYTLSQIAAVEAFEKRYTD